MAKRLVVLSILAFALSLVPARAQPPTQPERDSLVKHLDQTRKAFLASIAGLSEAQWTFRAGPDRWSIAEVAEHIAISETTLLGLVTDKIVKGPAVPRDPNPVSDEKNPYWGRTGLVDWYGSLGIRGRLQWIGVVFLVANGISLLFGILWTWMLVVCVVAFVVSVVIPRSFDE